MFALFYGPWDCELLNKLFFCPCMNISNTMNYCSLFFFLKKKSTEGKLQLSYAQFYIQYASTLLPTSRISTHLNSLFQTFQAPNTPTKKYSKILRDWMSVCVSIATLSCVSWVQKILFPLESSSKRPCYFISWFFSPSI